MWKLKYPFFPPKPPVLFRIRHQSRTRKIIDYGRIQEESGNDNAIIVGVKILFPLSFWVPSNEKID